MKDVGENMLRSTAEKSRLYLTAELLEVEVLPASRKSTGLFTADIKRFPPVEDVVTILDRIASRAFAP